MKKILLFIVILITPSNALSQDNANSFATIRDIDYDFDQFVSVVDTYNPNHVIRTLKKPNKIAYKMAIEDALDEKLTSPIVSVATNKTNEIDMRNAILNAYNKYCYENEKFYLKLTTSSMFIGTLVGCCLGYGISTFITKITGCNLNKWLMIAGGIYGFDQGLRIADRFNTIETSFKTRRTALRYIRRKLFAEKYFSDDFNRQISCNVDLPCFKRQQKELEPFLEHYRYNMD